MASDSDDEFNDESLWETELEIALLTKCDYGTIRNITKLRPIPDNLRSKVWKICLNVQQEIETNAISKWKEVFDLPQQDKIREDCKALAEKIHPDDKEQQFMAISQLESIITYYCKTNDEFYEKENGWIEILHPIMKLKLNKNETYSFFNAILKRYIPNDCVRNGSPYHLFRLLMLYHDPELCAYLDTKKISPDSYAHSWFRSLFATVTRPEVTLPLWDIYFQLGDQFLIFFMSLILLYNMREEILTKTSDKEKSELIKIIQESPASMDVEDLPDFNSLCQSFGTRTPQSFRKEYKKPLFEGVSLEKKASGIYQALCLPVSVDELLQANQLGSGGVRYFIIDCRPADKYNASHYATAFHLDANLMLENQAEFNQSVEALLAAQKQAIDSGSVAGGQHLCFMGSGAVSENNNQDEDKYVNMVVANFLQRKINYVSLALGGYEKLKQSVEDPEMIVGTELVSPQQARSKFTEEWVQKLNIKPAGDSLFNKFSSAFKMKSFDLNIKDKVKDYINSNLAATTTAAPANQTASTGMKKSASAPKHVSSSDKIGKLYRNQGNLFAIDDDANDDDDESGTSDRDRQSSLLGSLDGSQSEPELVSLKTWLEKPDIVNKFKCYHREKKIDAAPGEKPTEWVPGYLLLSKTHLYGLTQPVSNSKANKNGMVKIAVRHPLSSVIKIATKSSCPEILSFTYGEKKKSTAASATAVDEKNENEEQTGRSAEEEYEVQGKDWFFIPDYAGEAASAVKSKIIEIVDLMAS